MAEGMIDIQPIPENTNPKDRNVRRNSTGKTSTSDSGEKIVPHYLRSSTNSCHEFCKYGRKHAFEEVGKRPVLKGIRAKMVENQKPEKNITLVDRNKKPHFKPKLSFDKKVWDLDTREPINKEITFVKKIDVSAKPSTALKPKPVAAKSSSSPLSHSGGVTRRNSDVMAVKVSGASIIGQKKKALVLPKASLSATPSTRVANLNTKYKAPKAASSPLKNQKKVTKHESKLANDEKVREKTLYIIEPNSDDGSLKPDLSSPSSLSSSLPKPSPTFASGEREVEDEHHEEEEEEEYGDSEYTMDEENETQSESDETESGNQMETSNGEYKRRPRKTVHGEDTELAQKLKFRRGKVVDLQPENNGARRLKFNRGRVLRNNQNGENDTKRRFRRREVDDGDTNSGGPEPENVVLRHQDVQGKKDTQGLLNNVIEETASKLVEKRNSKVKALVGAFETVILLQESKPSATRTD